ncbi:MAG: extracellular solute-binding protein [Oscillospiraceae bacterium]|jgi:sn-glycerol 3-phosphate transport system substrate-binding protein|nr:extracellular solute-binding protein [Oscillospiraceae bacterium]
MKKWLGWALAALALLLLIVPGTLATAPEPVAITFWHSMSDKAGALVQQYVADFNETVGKEQGIVVTEAFQGPYADATQKLQSILTAQGYDSLPDLMQLDTTAKITYATSEVAYTIDELMASGAAVDLAQYAQSPLGVWKYGDQQLGLPFSTSTTVLYYNKTLLDAAGVAIPQTFADIAALAAKLPAQNEHGQPIHAMAAVPNTPSLANWLGQLGSYVVNYRNGAEQSATELACIDNGALVTFLSEWKALYASGALLNQGSGLTDMFVAGQLALLPESSSRTASLIASIGDKFELGVAYYPRVNATATAGATTSGGGLFLFDSGDEARKAAAWAFMDYLTSAAVQADFAIGTGYLPANLASVDESAYQAMIAESPMRDVARQQLADTPAFMQSVTVGPSIDFYYAIGDHISLMLEDDLTAEETAAALAEELQLLLDDYSRANPGA